MSKNFDALTLVPRHISKYINRNKKHEIHQGRFAPGDLRLDKPVSRWGTIGTDAEHHEYPDTQSKDLRKALARLQSVQEQQVFVGNGSDEVLDLLVRAFCTPGKDHALTFVPTAERYAHFCGIHGIHLDEVQLTGEFQLPLYKAKTSITEHTKILFIANPNPVTGVALRSFDMVDMMDAFDGIVVLDESLIDYNAEGSFMSFLHQYPNLVIVQSFSHAWGMAGLRLGVAYAHESVIAILNAIKAPHNVNAMAQTIGLQAIGHAHQRASVITETIQERERMRDALFRLKFVEEVEDSQANFLMIKSAQSAEIIRLLLCSKITVCDVSKQLGCAGGIRITIGTPAQNEQLLQVLRNIEVELSPGRRILRAVTNTLKKASSFLGFFKKIMNG